VPHERLKEFYELCDVFTLPSKLEAMPMVLLEALSFGKVAVTNSAPEKKFIIDKFGIFTNVENPNQYAESLVKAFSIKIDVNSLDYIKHMQKFNWSNIASQYEVVFHDVLQKRHSA
jgi:glycosyltransferase involved in cell wall biosynthesis